MTNRIAVDIALLPDEQMMKQCFDANAALLSLEPGPHTFHPDHCIPHLTLTMGVVRTESLAILQDRLHELSARHASPLLRGTLVSRALVPANGKSVTEIQVERESALVALHTEAQNMISDLLVDDATLDTLLQPPEADPITLEWIKNFRGRYSGDNFSPHITLGLGSLPTDETVMPFHAPTLVLAHLGNYCTCLKILTSAALCPVHSE